MCPDESDSQGLSQASPQVSVEVLSDADYQSQLQNNQTLTLQDAQARTRARHILKKCREGFVPNLIHGYRLLPYDGIFASKAILQLLELCLREDGACAPGARDRQAFSRPDTYAIARHCGKKINFIGGHGLMAFVLREWIPAFDQPNLSETWAGIGEWSGQTKLQCSVHRTDRSSDGLFESEDRNDEEGDEKTNHHS